MRTQRTGLAESTFGDVLEEMQRTLKLATGESRPLTLLDRKAAGAPTTHAAGGGGADLGLMVSSARAKNSSQLVRPAGLSAAAVDLTGAGIINLEAQKAERPSKMRLAVGDEEVRLAFRDDPEIKALGVML
jgi:origin recognition complex subunit 1